MKKSIKTLLLASLFIVIGCKKNEQATTESTAETTEVSSGGQENVVDESSVPNIVQTAVGSKSGRISNFVKQCWSFYGFCTNKYSI